MDKFINFYTCPVCSVIIPFEINPLFYINNNTPDINYCPSCMYTMETCVQITACRISLDIIPLVISSLKDGIVLKILKYRLEHGIKSIIEFPTYQSCDEDFKMIKTFLSEIFHQKIEFKKALTS